MGTKVSYPIILVLALTALVFVAPPVEAADDGTPACYLRLEFRISTVLSGKKTSRKPQSRVALTKVETIADYLESEVRRYDRFSAQDAVLLVYKKRQRKPVQYGFSSGRSTFIDPIDPEVGPVVTGNPESRPVAVIPYDDKIASLKVLLDGKQHQIKLPKFQVNCQPQCLSLGAIGSFAAGQECCHGLRHAQNGDGLFRCELRGGA